MILFFAVLGALLLLVGAILLAFFALTTILLPGDFLCFWGFHRWEFEKPAPPGDDAEWWICRRCHERWLREKGKR